MLRTFVTQQKNEIELKGRKNEKNLFLKKRPIRMKKNAFHIAVSVGLVRTRTVISKKTC